MPPKAEAYGFFRTRRRASVAAWQLMELTCP